MFGAHEEGMDKENVITAALSLTDNLQKAGFLAHVAPDSGKIALRLNEKLFQMLKATGVRTAPFVDKGPLREVYLRQKERMLGTGLEGMVVAGWNFLSTWKTAFEDESKGFGLLSSLLHEISPIDLRLAAVDIDLVKCLAEVSGNKAHAETKDKRSKAIKTTRSVN